MSVTKGNDNVSKVTNVTDESSNVSLVADVTNEIVADNFVPLLWKLLMRVGALLCPTL